MIYIFKPGGAVLASCVDVMVVLSCVVAGVFVVGWVTLRECCHTANIKDRNIEFHSVHLSLYNTLQPSYCC